jgi:prepilin-type N-terminal cleavage/methylation domain-containing protein
MKKNAFTLIELSIVIVIISLIISVISMASSLLKTTEVRAVIKEISNYKAVVDIFRNTYDSLPGDFTGAYGLWNTSITTNNTNDPNYYPLCTNNDVNTTANGCNGNGNGVINTGYIEDMRSWQHLSLAGLIPGDYPGISPTNNTPSASTPLAGYNVPTSKLAGAAYALDHFGAYTRVGDGIRLFNASNLNYSIITPLAAYTIDNKIDDSIASTGNVMTNQGSDNSAVGVCTNNQTNTADYNMTDNGKTCRMFIFFD